MMAAAPALVTLSHGGRMLPFLFGSACTAGAAGLLPPVPDTVKNALGMALTKIPASNDATSSSSSSAESSMIMAQLAELRNALSNRSPNVTVVSSGDAKGTSNAASTVTIVVGGVTVASLGYALLRFYGIGIGDVAWVTKKKFLQAIAGIESGMDSLSARLTSVRLALTKQIDAVSTKQDETLTKQAELRDALSRVGYHVEGVGVKVESVCEKQDETNVKIDQCGHGIRLLCGVVSESLNTQPQIADQLRRYSASSSFLTHTHTPPAAAAMTATAMSSRATHNTGVASLRASSSMHDDDDDEGRKDCWRTLSAGQIDRVETTEA